MDMLKLILDNSPDMLDAKSDDGKTPLFNAAAQNGEFHTNKQLIVFRM